MKRIEVKLSLSVVAPLLDLMKASSDVLEAQIAAPLTLDDIDVDFRDEWKAELLKGQHEELHALMGLFNSDFFVNGVVAFDEENAEIIVRACSALRLRLPRHDSGADHPASGFRDPSRFGGRRRPRGRFRFGR
jgi:hypothetical protein